MFHVDVDQVSLKRRIHQLHLVRERKWKKNGSIGKKPKEYEAARDVIAKGLKHPDIIREFQEADATEAR